MTPMSTTWGGWAPGLPTLGALVFAGHLAPRGTPGRARAARARRAQRACWQPPRCAQQVRMARHRVRSRAGGVGACPPSSRLADQRSTRVVTGRPTGSQHVASRPGIYDHFTGGSASRRRTARQGPRHVTADLRPGGLATGPRLTPLSASCRSSRRAGSPQQAKARAGSRAPPRVDHAHRQGVSSPAVFSPVPVTDAAPTGRPRVPRTGSAAGRATLRLAGDDRAPPRPA